MFSASLELILHVAYREAISRRHTHLTLEHLLFALAHDTEAERILAACGADLPALRRTLDEFLGSLEKHGRRGRGSEPAQTLAFRRVLQNAVLHVQSANKDEVRSGDVLAAILQQPKAYAAQVLEQQGITRLDILNYISHGISKVSSEAAGREDRRGGAEAGAGQEGPASARDPLGAYTVNLTERAKAGALDPLIGRTPELQRTLQILCRRRKNNPVFVGDAGVGKTALAEGLAARLTEPETPARLAGAEVFALDTAALLAGTRFRGDFEERFKAVTRALADHPLPILFIDEVHATVGAGATTGGTMDLATLIKPVLSAGELRVIGSTTFEEFKHIEKDRALARRLQKVVVEEPTVDETSKILEGLRSRYEEHHGVTFAPETVQAAARLAKRHLRDSRLPDGAIDIIDEAGATIGMQRTACAVGATDAKAGTENATGAQGVAGTRTAAGAQDTAGAQDAAGAQDTPGAAGAEAGAPGAEDTPDAAGTEGGAPGAEPPQVTVADIERVVARMARIPEKQATSSDKERLRTLDEALERVVFGQSDAVRAVVTAIKRSRAGLGTPDRPAGCFLFTGPTGVGKTELARQLAIHLGNEFVRYDMSEYMEKHAVARLIGAPPGYVGFEQGGLLVDAVRAHPYSVVLLDEIEKAHPDIYNILLQVMDHATLTDNGGRKADFRHVILIMTSNAGSREASAGAIGFSDDRASTAKARMKAAIERIFSPEFRNRLDGIVPFDPLTPATMETIVEKFILQLESQLAERRIAITLEADARAWLARKGCDPVYGARPLARVVQTEVRNPLTDEILFGRLERGGTVRIGVEGDALTFAVDAAAAPPAAEPPARTPEEATSE